MGWLWSTNQNSDDSQPPLSISTPPPPPPPPPSSSAEETPTPPILTRDEAADAELLAFLQTIQSEPTPQQQKQPPTTSTSSTSSDPPLLWSAPTSTPTSTPITPNQIHPTTMSCRAAFDTAFYCQSLGGQFNGIYRHGSVRNCSELWGNFWFCVRTNRRWMSEEERQGRVLEHYRQRERKYVDGPSSDDVWRARERMVVGAFEGDFEAVERWEKEQKGDGGGVG